VNPRLPASVGPHQTGPDCPLLLIAGPCVIDDESLCLGIADTLARLADTLPINVVFKASFDKANRTSMTSYRGLGQDEGLAVLFRGWGASFTRLLPVLLLVMPILERLRALFGVGGF